MSAYPPPSPYPPYDRRAMAQAAKAQRQAMKLQARMQRDQARLLYRATRRRSVVGPLLLVALGVVLLLVQLGRLTWARSLDWYGHWWPMVLIGAGLLLLLEWSLDQRTNVDGTPRAGRSLGAGVVVLLVFLAIAGAGARAIAVGMQWKEAHLGTGFRGWDFALGDEHDWDDTVSAAMPAGGMLTVRNPHGDVTVTGTSEDGQVHVSVHKSARTFDDNDAKRKEQLLQPAFVQDGANLTLNVAWVRGGSDDLTIQLPRATPLTLNVDEGEVSVSEIHAPVTIAANHGEVNVNGIDGAVLARVNDSHESVSAHSVTGGVTVDGHAGDVNVSDVTGPVDLRGAFFGSTHLERVNGTVSFKTYRTQFTAARIDGEFEVSTDSNLQASQVLGPVFLKTSDRDITLDRVQGSVDITNTDGPVKVTNAAPLSNISISNHDGSVDVGLPAAAGFTVSAETKDGDIENDFGLEVQKSNDRHSMNGTVGRGGPSVKIVTGEGDVTVHKTTVAPLPPTPPAPPRITVEPAAPAAPPPPHAPKPGRAPAAPKAPAPPPPPAPVTI